MICSIKFLKQLSIAPQLIFLLFIRKKIILGCIASREQRMLFSRFRRLYEHVIEKAGPQRYEFGNKCNISKVQRNFIVHRIVLYRIS